MELRKATLIHRYLLSLASTLIAHFAGLPNPLLAAHFGSLLAPRKQFLLSFHEIPTRERLSLHRQTERLTRLLTFRFRELHPSYVRLGVTCRNVQL